MGLLGCTKTSVRNCHYSLRNNTEELSSQVIFAVITYQEVIVMPPTKLNYAVIKRIVNIRKRQTVVTDNIVIVVSLI
jgi:hypothetical protein